MDDHPGWARLGRANPPGTGTVSLGTSLSIACPSTTSCVAVGAYKSGFYWTALLATGAP